MLTKAELKAARAADLRDQLRDYFAGLAMQAYIACDVGDVRQSDGTPFSAPILAADFARLAYEQADAMLKEREKGQ